MTNEELRQKLVTTLGLTDASEDDQNVAIYRIESLAQKQFALELPDMLSDEQLDEVERMREAHKTPDEVIDWAAQQLPDYEATMQTLLLEVAETVAGA